MLSQFCYLLGSEIGLNQLHLCSREGVLDFVRGAGARKYEQRRSSFGDFFPDLLDEIIVNTEI